jgi:hypothetical protein
LTVTRLWLLPIAGLLLTVTRLRLLPIARLLLTVGVIGGLSHAYCSPCVFVPAASPGVRR